MKFDSAYSHHLGVEVWKSRALYSWATRIFAEPGVTIHARATTAIRDHVRHVLEADGWAFGVRIDAGVRLNVFARKHDLAFQLQTGNISRYAYDVLKLQHLYMKREIASAVLAVPSREASKKLGSNVAHADRILAELEVFDRIITLPLMVIAFS